MSTRKDPVAEFYRLKLEKIERRKRFWKEFGCSVDCFVTTVLPISLLAFFIIYVICVFSGVVIDSKIKRSREQVESFENERFHSIYEELTDKFDRLDKQNSALFDQTSTVGRKSIESTSALRGLIESQQGVISGLLDRVQALEHPSPARWDTSKNATNILIPLSPFTVTNYATPFYIVTNNSIPLYGTTTNSGTWGWGN